MKDPSQQPERGLLARLVLDNYPLKLLSLAVHPNTPPEEAALARAKAKELAA